MSIAKLGYNFILLVILYLQVDEISVTGFEQNASRWVEDDSGQWVVNFLLRCCTSIQVQSLLAVIVSND